MLELLLSDILRDATCPLAVPLGGGELLMAYSLYSVGRTYTHVPGVGGGGWRLEALLYHHRTWQSVAQTWPKGSATNDRKV